MWSADGNRKNPVPSCSAVPMPRVLWVGPSLDSYWSESGDVTLELRSDSTPGRLALSWWDLCVEDCGTALALWHRFRPEAIYIYIYTYTYTYIC